MGNEKLDSSRAHLMAELKRWGNAGEGPSDATKHVDADAVDAPRVPEHAAKTKTTSLSDKIAAQKKLLRELNKQQKEKAAVKKKAEAKKLAIAKKKKAELKALEAKVAAA